ncbi:MULTISPECIES: transposase [unclassified Paenibacillus]|uniref:transposase n=1 Tax=unclassified Paenibacillus TaxID=185978 RepID=UPI0024066350|nr:MULTISPECIES: transposase [unclassified Paenibacillus]MDF9843463.1 transposase-like protein [Paenibacillus sp. PastF-2]MDF9850051.1 transposase-like protein [Paenibacillus sp. PastM-2]MDH6482029.1 transposase-like protein [Paenibacillus sp. PastH-2]MDH6509453.1 transposase-like protein [Paenibacillus sp. PastM-3]
MGIDEEGHRQILGFYVGGQESANGWREVLKDLCTAVESMKSCWVYSTGCRD